MPAAPTVAVPLVRRPLCASAATRPVDVARRLRWAVVAAAAVSLLVPAWPGLGLGLLALLAPDVPLLLPRAWADDGRLRPWAVPFYNATHALAGPLLVGLVGLVGLVALVGASGALARAGTAALGVGAGWLAHVAVDRVLGYDLRDAYGDVRR